MKRATADIAWRVAEGAALDERRFSRMCGATWFDAFVDSELIWMEVYQLALTPDRPVVFSGLRMICNRRE